MRFRVSRAANAPIAAKELTWTLTLDGARMLGQGTLSLESGAASVEGGLDQPGVRQFKATPAVGAEKLGIGMAAAAFDPYRIEATAKLPSDFEEFWNAPATL